jgi:hypothetical protein
MPLSDLKQRLRDQAPQRRLSRGKLSFKNISNTRDATNTLAGRIKNMQIRLAKKHTQISITKLRDRKQVVSQLVHKSDIIQGEAVIYLNDAGPKHLTLLVISKQETLKINTEAQKSKKSSKTAQNLKINTPLENNSS